MGCLLLIFMPFVLIYKFVRWALSNGAKGWIILAVVVIFGLIGFSVVKSAITHGNSKPAAVSIPAPSSNEAPFVVHTSSRMYYAKQAVKAKDGTVTMTVYWELSGGKWNKNNGTFTLDKSFGNVTIEKRKGG